MNKPSSGILKNTFKAQTLFFYLNSSMRKLWNRPDQAIWSLVTKDTKGSFNMNICSYVTAVSMEPKVMMIAIYKGTLTRENVVVGDIVRLQLLTQSQAPLVRLLGQQSGYDVPKIARLEKRGLIAVVNQWPYLAGCAGYLDLKLISIIEANLDHDLVLGSVEEHRNISAESILTTTYLKDNKFTR